MLSIQQKKLFHFLLEARAKICKKIADFLRTYLKTRKNSSEMQAHSMQKLVKIEKNPN